MRPRPGAHARSRPGAAFPHLLTCSLLSLFLWSCGRDQPAGRGPANPPDLILISIDTLRPDHLSGFGYERGTSPFLDSLATEGVRFHNAFAQASWTLPSHMSIVTSTYPHTHGVENRSRRLPDDITTLAEVLHDSGYYSAGFITWTYLMGIFGFDRGFDEYHELLPPLDAVTTGASVSVRAGEVVDRVSLWADRWHAERSASSSAMRQPVFLFLHLFDPHMDYDPPLEIARRLDPSLISTTDGAYDHLKQFIPGISESALPPPPSEIEKARTLYDAEILYTDQQLARLFGKLASVGLLENSVIVVTSDHGEEFGEHDSMEGHQWTLYDEVLRIPLFFVLPDHLRKQGRIGSDRGRSPEGSVPGRNTRTAASGQGGDSSPPEEGRAVDTMVESIDIAPTILELLDLEIPTTAQGRSLLRFLDTVDRVEATADEAAGGWEPVTFSQIRRFNMKWAIRSSTHKLIFTKDTKTNTFGVPIRPGLEMYDLRNDPVEQRNIYQHESPIARELRQRLRDFMLARREGPETEAPQLSPEERERLRSLGYIGD